MKKIFATLLTLLLMLSSATVVMAATASGTAGENVTWTLDNYGKLTIRGTGPMDSFEYDEAPWQDYEKSITDIVIEEGVTSIGANAFVLSDSSLGTPDIDSISMPSTLTTIDEDAFPFTSVTGITVHKDNPSFCVQDGVLFDKDKTALLIFPSGDKIYTYTVPETVTRIAKEAFRFNPYLLEITMLDNVTQIGESVLYDGATSKTKIVVNDESYAQTYFADKYATLEVLAKDVISAGTIWCSGISDNHVKYTLDESGVLKIYGTGGASVIDYEKTDVPWQKYIDTVKSVVVEEGVTGIPDFCFKSSHNLETISISSTLGGIGIQSTYDCPKLKTFTVAEGNDTYYVWDGVLYRKSGSFYYVRRYPEAKEGTYYRVRDGITQIDDGAFYNCDKLTVIDLPKSMGTDDNFVSKFASCDSLEAINIVEDGLDYYSRDGVVYNSRTDGLLIYPKNKKDEVYTVLRGTPSIGNSAFISNKNLTKVILPDSLTTIGSAAFSDCEKLESVTIPAAVTSIGSSAFSGCISLADLTFEDGTDKLTIGQGAFWNCGITELTIPKRASLANWWVFRNCPDLVSVTIEDGVASIPRECFRECTNLETVVIPGSVETIAYQAFYGCEKLKNLTLSNGIKTLEYGAFCGCKALESISLPDSITSVDSYVFSGCESLTSFELSSALTSIPGNMFSETAVKEVIIPEHIQTIGGSAFAKTPIESITIPETVKTLSYNAFDGCTDLKSITIEAPLATISGYAFRDCTSLTEITLPDTVTSIGEYAFSGCSALKRIIIPDTVTSIGASAFENCTELEFLYTSESQEEKFVLPSSLTSLGANAFAGCVKIGEVTIPGSVATLDASAFANCTGLSTITLDEGVTQINNAFSGCTNIKYIYMPESLSSIKNDIHIVPDSADAVIVAEKYSYVYYYANRKGITFSEPMIIITSLPEIPDITVSIFGAYSYNYYMNAETSDESGVLLNVVYSQKPSTDVSGETTVSATFIIPDGYVLADGVSDTVTFTVTVVAANESGICGDAADWKLENGTLTINGSGDMYDYSDGKPSGGAGSGEKSASISSEEKTSLPPWYEWSNQIVNIIIDDGITSIGNNAFYGCYNVEEVTIAATVTAIGENAFSDANPVNVYYEGTQEGWDAITFESGNTGFDKSTVHTTDKVETVPVSVKIPEGVVEKTAVLVLGAFDKEGRFICMVPTDIDAKTSEMVVDVPKEGVAEVRPMILGDLKSMNPLTKALETQYIK